MNGLFADDTARTHRRAILREIGTRLRTCLREMTNGLPARFESLLKQLRAKEEAR